MYAARVRKHRRHLSLIALLSLSFLLFLRFYRSRDTSEQSAPTDPPDPTRLDPLTPFVFAPSEPGTASLDQFEGIAAEVEHRSQALALPLPASASNSDEQSGGHSAVIEFSIMSRCPDAPVCLKEFAPAVKRLHAMQGTTVAVNYITDADRGRPKCMHGDEECVDNIYQLCAHDLYSGGEGLAWFDFVLCSSETKNAKACAERHGLDFQTIQNCAFSASGTRKLVRSVLHTRALGAKYSCTVSVDGVQFCVHNGDWAGCKHGHSAQALVDFVCSRHPESCLEARDEGSANED